MQPIPSFWQKITVWNLSRFELAAFFGVYTFFSTMYTLALVLSISNPLLERTFIDYSLKLIYSIPIWWLLFRKLRHWPDKSRLLFHIVLCPLYIFVWIKTYHAVIDYFELGRLRGAGMWWDVYIPFLFYVVQFGIIHSYDFWKKNQAQMEREKELIQHMHKSELNALKAQIQPHFLFNTLNSISAAVPAELEHTREMIAKLADTFRYTLKASREDKIRLKEEIQFIGDCLALEQQRFNDRLTVKIKVDPILNEQYIPPMLLQPLVENAVIHGIAKNIEGGEITIDVRREERYMHFSIGDTGVGHHVQDTATWLQKGVGLFNTNQRLLKLYNEPVLISQNKPQGTMLTFRIPISD
jgi:two-component system LytT family sensor kinase